MTTKKKEEVVVEAEVEAVDTPPDEFAPPPPLRVLVERPTEYGSERQWVYSADIERWIAEGYRIADEALQGA